MKKYTLQVKHLGFTFDAEKIQENAIYTEVSDGATIIFTTFTPLTQLKKFSDFLNNDVFGIAGPFDSQNAEVETKKLTAEVERELGL